MPGQFVMIQKFLLPFGSLHYILLLQPYYIARGCWWRILHQNDSGLGCNIRKREFILLGGMITFRRITAGDQEVGGIQFQSRNRENPQYTLSVVHTAYK